MACTSQCRKVSGRQAHCSACHRSFSGVRNFDVHRNKGVCADPSRRNMTNRDGIWGYHGTFATDRQFWDKP